MLKSLTRFRLFLFKDILQSDFPFTSKFKREKKRVAAAAAARKVVVWGNGYFMKRLTSSFLCIFFIFFIWPVLFHSLPSFIHACLRIYIYINSPLPSPHFQFHPLAHPFSLALSSSFHNTILLQHHRPSMCERERESKAKGSEWKWNFNITVMTLLWLDVKKGILKSERKFSLSFSHSPLSLSHLFFFSGTVQSISFYGQAHFQFLPHLYVCPSREKVREKRGTAAAAAVVALCSTYSTNCSQFIKYSLSFLSLSYICIFFFVYINSQPTKHRERERMRRTGRERKCVWGSR